VLEWFESRLRDGLEGGAKAHKKRDASAPGATPNTANCWLAVQDLTDVGSYTDSASSNGTFDQGGHVWEWTEAIIGSDRGLRGGRFYNGPSVLAASFRFGYNPTYEGNGVGFRVASILLAADLAGLAVARRPRSLH
jgi:formylglycine-generating enzyme required for sulfatase activity